MFHYLKIPTIVGFILTGMLVGPYGFKLIETIPQVSILNEIGLALLMFTIGLEFSRKKIKGTIKVTHWLRTGDDRRSDCSDCHYWYKFRTMVS